MDMFTFSPMKYNHFLSSINNKLPSQITTMWLEVIHKQEPTVLQTRQHHIHCTNTLTYLVNVNLVQLNPKLSTLCDWNSSDDISAGHMF